MLNDRQHGGGGGESHRWEDIISVENILAAWDEFVCGKRKKKDVQEFQFQLMDNVIELHESLKEGAYRHGLYYAFKIADPKPRDIHKASVRDRLVHHTFYRKLYPYFDARFIADSYSCRENKGTHKALNRFRTFYRKVSLNKTKTCWVLKCDIRKFFASIDHKILKQVLGHHIRDPLIVEVLGNIIDSFESTALGKGLPLGNLTSQLLVNVYMNEFDQFVKHELKAKYYIRYADDFVILSRDRSELERILVRIGHFLEKKLDLKLHPNKVSIATFSSGVDFLGWVHFPDHQILRTSSKKRMIRNLIKERNEARVQSYKGMLSHGNAHKLVARYLS